MHKTAEDCSLQEIPISFKSSADSILVFYFHVIECSNGEAPLFLYGNFLEELVRPFFG